VFIDFWASWCGPCRKESPNLVKAYARFKDKNFEIVSFSLDRDPAAWKAAAKEDGYTWPQVSDLKEFQSAIARSYMVVAVPTCFLLDPDGKIVATGLRGDALEKQLEKIFN
jgi:thiol-disulfide isomerase/thioredoxin